MNGAQHICKVLESRGVKHVFGLPGSQNAPLFSELRRSSVESVVTTSELSAGFAAMGYAATTFRPAVMAIIGGPGFTYAITSLQEARLDSVPLVCLVFAREGDPTKAYRLQQMDYEGVASSICKSVLEVRSLDRFTSTFDRAAKRATDSEPGPVVIVIEAALLDQPCKAPITAPERERPLSPNDETISIIAEQLNGKRVLLFLGRGAAPYSTELTQFAKQLNAAVMTSTSGRGTISEKHPNVIQSDLVPRAVVNEFVAGFDRVLALGIRFSENGSRGYGLEFFPDQLIHVDSCANVLGANYKPAVSLVSDVGDTVRQLRSLQIKTSEVSRASLSEWRTKFQQAIDCSSEPIIQGIEPPTARAFFNQLRNSLPDDAILLADSGTHQMLARKHFEVRCSAGMLVPANFQSMGFAISGAIGASIAHPYRHVVAIVGDGGLQMSGQQLLAAVQQRPITVFVFSDGYFGLIRGQQIGYDGHEAGTVLPPLDIAAFCDAIGAKYFDGSTSLMSKAKSALASDELSIVEVVLDDAKAVRRQRTKSRIKRVIKDSLGDRILRWIKSNLS